MVHQIYNNAGIAYTGAVEVSQFKDIERVVDVDFWGVVNGTKAFLPHLLASGDGHVVNVSSLFGIFAVPGQSAYNAAKFAVRGFTEALRQEMLVAGHPVAVTTVHPGGIKTAIARNATAADGLDSEELAKVFDPKYGDIPPDLRNIYDSFMEAPPVFPPYTPRHQPPEPQPQGVSYGMPAEIARDLPPSRPVTEEAIRSMYPPATLPKPVKVQPEVKTEAPAEPKT